MNGIVLVVFDTHTAANERLYILEQHGNVCVCVCVCVSKCVCECTASVLVHGIRVPKVSVPVSECVCAFLCVPVCVRPRRLCDQIFMTEWTPIEAVT